MPLDPRPFAVGDHVLVAGDDEPGVVAMVGTVYRRADNIAYTRASYTSPLIPVPVVFIRLTHPEWEVVGARSSIRLAGNALTILRHAS